MYVWCVDAQTSNSQEALRFIEFSTNYLDPVYACYLSPCEYESIPSTKATAQRDIWEKAYQQAMASNSKDAKSARLTLSTSIQSLNPIPPLLSRQIFDFYHQEAVPRLRLLLGGMYFDMEQEYGSSTDPFDAIYGVIDGEMTIDESIQLLNQESVREYALWN